MSIFSPFFNKLRANKKVRELVFRFRPSHKTLTFFHNLALPKKTRNPVLRELDAIKKQIEAVEFRQELAMNHYLDISQAKDPTGFAVEARKTYMFIFKEFIRLCEIANIDYWVDSGTLLGAVRHGKMIPWDHDLDVAILLPDLDKLTKAAKENLSEGFFYRPSKEVGRLQYDKIYIDIYAYHDNIDRIKLCAYATISINSNRSIPKEIVFPLKKLSFENIDVNVPAEYDKYLRLQYGNYEKFPSKPHPLCNIDASREHIIFYPNEKF